MQTRFILPLIAGLALTAPAAFAQPATAHHGHHWRSDAKDGHWDMAKHFKDRCADRYARAVGGMAYLETRLDLSAKQKPAFAHWKEVVLGSIKSASDQCAAMKPPAEKPSLVDMMKFHERGLQMRLDGIKAQMPALETLTASLNDNQDRILARGIHKLMRGEHGRHGRHGRHGFRHGDRDRDQGGPRGPGGPDQDG